jgi:hypothetical protein
MTQELSIIGMDIAKSVFPREHGDAGDNRRTPVELSLFRLDHRQPRVQAPPAIVQGAQQSSITRSRTPCFHKRNRSLTIRQHLTLLWTCSMRQRR